MELRCKRCETEQQVKNGAQRLNQAALEEEVVILLYQPVDEVGQV